MRYTIIKGDNRSVLKTIPDNSVDAIITDPPYGIDFLGKAWDANTGSLETYQQCLRVLKPGGHILAFSAARTYHHLAVTLEQAGFEIRDQIMWIYSSGFPKSQDVGKSIQRSLGVKETKTTKALNGYAKEQTTHGAQRVGDVTKDDYEKEITQTVVTDTEAKVWEGWGTALKPAHEPICLARKPTKLSIAQNVQRWGTGALNIDAGRIPWNEESLHNIKKINAGGGHNAGRGIEKYESIGESGDKEVVKTIEFNEQGRFPSNVIGEIEQPYQKYFYCPKVSRSERHTGFDTSTIPTNPNGMWDDGVQFQNQQAFLGNTEKGNNHPTVKPVELMKYLIKLVTPPNGRVLDPFNGSGSTGMAAVELGYEYIGIEQDEKYCEISRKRIAAHLKSVDPLRASGLFD